MIFSNSLLKVSDNSGVTLVKCIKVLNTNVGKVTNYLIVILKNYNLKKNKKISLKKKNKYLSLLIRTKKSILREDCSRIQFLSNDIILLKNKTDILSSRIKGILPKELSSTKIIFKVLSEGFF